MTGESLGFGIIGCGMIAQWHVKAIRSVRGAQLISVTDINESIRTAFSHQFNVPSVDSFEAMLCDKNVKVVSICTPSGLHAALAVQAAYAGKHIVVEKPMAISIEEADEIIRACTTNNVKLCVISQLRFSDAVKTVKTVLDQNRLGKLVSGDIYMKFHRSQAYYDQSRWRGTWSMDGGGALMNQGIHGVDVLRYLMGPVQTVYAFTRTLARQVEVEDTVAAVLEYENGALGIIQATTSVYPGSPRRFEFNGDRGTVVIEEDKIVTWAVDGLTLPEKMNQKHTEICSASDPSAFGIEGHVRQIRDMVDSIRINKNPVVDQYEGRKPIEIISAIYRSSRTGFPVNLSCRSKLTGRGDGHDT